MNKSLDPYKPYYIGVQCICIPIWLFWSISQGRVFSDVALGVFMCLIAIPIALMFVFVQFGVAIQFIKNWTGLSTASSVIITTIFFCLTLAVTLGDFVIRYIQ